MNTSDRVQYPYAMLCLVDKAAKQRRKITTVGRLLHHTNISIPSHVIIAVIEISPFPSLTMCIQFYWVACHHFESEVIRMKEQVNEKQIFPQQHSCYFPSWFSKSTPPCSWWHWRLVVGCKQYLGRLIFQEAVTETMGQSTNQYTPRLHSKWHPVPYLVHWALYTGNSTL